MMPTTELLLGAIYGEDCSVDAGDSYQDLVPGQNIVVKEIIYDGRKEDDRPEVDYPAPVPE